MTRSMEEGTNTQCYYLQEKHSEVYGSKANDKEMFFMYALNIVG